MLFQQQSNTRNNKHGQNNRERWIEQEKEKEEKQHKKKIKQNRKKTISHTFCDVIGKFIAIYTVLLFDAIIVLT